MPRELIARAWNQYRRGGLGSLAGEASKRLRRRVPFRYRIAARVRWQRYKYGPAAVTEPLYVFSVDPHRIEHEGPRFERSRRIGTVASGEWDRDVSEWDRVIHTSLKNRFEGGDDWAETAYYRKAKRRIERDGYYLGYTDFETFRSERLAYVDRLFERIREDGYRTQAELAASARDDERHETVPAHHRLTHEVGCNVARDGTLVFNSGKHRLAIAKILDLDAIPIQVIVRHRGWMQRRRAVVSADDRAAAMDRHGVPADHPDLEELLGGPRDATPKR